jgi:hypothetical protein
VVSGFQVAVGTIGGIRLVVESAVGERAAEALVKEQEQERDIHAFGGQAVSVAPAIALEKSVAFQFADVVAELVQSVGPWGKLECRDYGLVDLFSGPAADGVAAVQQDFQQPNDAGVMDFDAGIANRTDGDGKGDFLQQGKVHMHVEALRLEGGETVRDGLEARTHRSEMIQTFPQAEVVPVIG